MFLCWARVVGWRIARKTAFERKVSNETSDLLRGVAKILSDSASDQQIRKALYRHVGDYAYFRAVNSRMEDIRKSVFVVILLFSAFLSFHWTISSCRQIPDGGLWAVLVGACCYLLLALATVIIGTLLKPRGNKAVVLLILAGLECIPLPLLMAHSPHSSSNWLLESACFGSFGSGIFFAWFVFVHLIDDFVGVVVADRLFSRYPQSRALWLLAEILEEISIARESILETDATRQSYLVKHDVGHHARMLQLFIGFTLENSLTPAAAKRRLREEYISQCVREIRQLDHSLRNALDPITWDEFPEPFAYAERIRTNLPVSPAVERNMRSLQSSIKDLAEDLGKIDIIDPDLLVTRLTRCKETLNELDQSLKAVNGEYVLSYARDSVADLRFQHATTRRSMLSKLENVAKSIEIMPTLLPANDPVHAAWERRVYAERAAAIRDLKKWVLLPFDCTRRDLDTKLRAILAQLSGGNWAALDHMDPERLPSLPWWQKAWNIVRSLLIAFVPLAAVFAAKWAGIQLPPPVDTWAFPVAFGWAAMTLLAMLDPRFGEKISTFKDWPKIFTLGSKERGEPGSRSAGD